MFKNIKYYIAFGSIVLLFILGVSQYQKFEAKATRSEAKSMISSMVTYQKAHYHEWCTFVPLEEVKCFYGDKIFQDAPYDFAFIPSDLPIDIKEKLSADLMPFYSLQDYRIIIFKKQKPRFIMSLTPTGSFEIIDYKETRSSQKVKFPKGINCTKPIEKPAYLNSYCS
jgi:hypothetical protein